MFIINLTIQYQFKQILAKKIKKTILQKLAFLGALLHHRRRLPILPLVHGGLLPRHLRRRDQQTVQVQTKQIDGPLFFAYALY